MDTVYQILTYVFSGTTFMGLVGSIAYYAQTKRTKEAEAKLKEAEVEKAEVDKDRAKVDVELARIESSKHETERLHAQIDHQQTTIENLISLNNNLLERLSHQNAAIDKHIDRRRELTDKLNEAQNDKLRLTEERDNERARADYNEMWRCEWTDCKDPRGPKPPREKLRGMKYIPPSRP